ncbi:MAG TPA: ATP synthase F1 subunit gamma [bacterium]|nr:ATP synthase F1 subunit gamma [bacterium]HPN32040.1 ATP synthase F1 subunit gamma [bacterium]
MPSLKDIRFRIKAVKSTQQITRAMKMVASAKFKKAEQLTVKYRNFKKKIEEIGLSLAMRCDPKEYFLLDNNGSGTVGLVVITSDRGLCGAFNSLLMKSVLHYVKELETAGKKCKIWVIGRKGTSFFSKQKLDIEKSFVGIYRNLDIKIADNISREIIEKYKNGEIGKMVICYNYYKSIMRQIITYKNILPISDNISQLNETNPALKSKLELDTSDYIYEPSEVEILMNLIPMYVSAEIYSSIIESQTGELASRMTAMDNATNNAMERIRILTIQYNRLRQAAITKEIAEIVGGASALEQ